MKVAVISPNRFAYTETFIRAHVERLPKTVGEVVHLYGARTPIWKGEGERIPPWYLHAASSAVAGLLGRPSDSVLTFLANQLPARARTRAVAKSLNREDIDVVLAEYGPTGVAVMHAAAAEEIPLVVHFHGYDAFRYSLLEKYRGKYRRLFQIAHAAVAVSKDMADQLCRLGAESSRIHLCPYGIDLNNFEPVDVAESEPNFVAVGRFVDKKAPHLTVLAFAEVLARHSSARLIMAGDGPLLDMCQTLVRGLGIEEFVRFPGSIPHDAVRDLMQNARAFVQHSIRSPSGDSEGNPVAIREAMAAGLPVISTRHAGIPDTVHHEVTGFLVNEYDWKAMSEHMNRMVEDPGLAGNLGRAGRRWAEEEFAMDLCLARLASVLRQASGRPLKDSSSAR